MTSDQNWYLEYKKNPSASVRLFCFHHSGGGASSYYPWINHLSPNIEMIAVQLPGRENRFTEPLNNSMEDIIAQLSERFVTYTDKPFFVFGHSLGALLSFEFIKSVHQAYSVYPCHMIISATKAPHLPFRMKHLSQLDDKALKEQLKMYNGIDERILYNDELLDLFLPIIKSDFSIYETYSFLESKPLPCNILALSGREDKTVNSEEIWAWEKYTEGKFERLSFPGEHFFVRDNQRQILEIINQIGDRYTQNMDCKNLEPFQAMATATFLSPA
jgi:medium-chain acyl-[acyl-carrier-protein] hydrolase